MGIKNIVFFFLIFIIHVPIDVKSATKDIINQVEIAKIDTCKIKSLLPPPESSFLPYDLESDSAEKESCFWLKFKLSPLQMKGTYYMTCQITGVKKAILLYEQDGIMKSQITGYGINIKNRSIKIQTPLLELPVSDKPITCYLYVENSYGYWFPFYTYEASNQLELEVKQTQVEIFFLGISVLAFLLGFVLWIYSKEKLYVYYMLLTGVFIFLRIFDNRLIFYITSDIFYFSNLRQFLNTYSFASMLSTIMLMLYISEFIDLRKQNPIAYLTMIVLCTIKICIWIIHFIFFDTVWGRSLETPNVDIAMILALIIILIFSAKKHPILIFLSLCSLLLYIVGISYTFQFEFLGLTNYQSHLTISNLEIFLFIIGIGYRFEYLKKEKNKADLILISTLKESEKLKIEINKELALKVHERTAEIQKMYQILKKNNIKLEEEMKDLTVSKVLNKTSNYEEFSKIFPEDETCYQFLSDLKWPENTIYKCQRCKNKVYVISKNNSRRCVKCSFNESTTAFTLFHNVKFPIQKAFYITYLTSTGSKENTIEESAKMLELRIATYWSFKQKVLTLMEKTKNLKKHKDGWTHLIEYSIHKTG